MAHPYIEGVFTNLNQEEQDSILHYLRLQDSSSDNKSVAYLKGVFTKDQTYKGSKAATEALRSRLFEKTIDALILEKHISNNVLHSEHDQTVFRLKKRLLHFRILLRSLNQGRVNSLKSILNNIISDAKTNEVYDVLLEALTLKKHFVGIRLGIKEFEKIGKEIEVCNETYRSVLYANDAYYQLILNNNLLKSYSKEIFKKKLTTIIRKLKKDFEKTGSEQINYYLHLILLIYNEHNKKYGMAIKYCKELIVIINISKVMYRRERIGFALDNLSQYKTFVGKFQAAAKNSIQAQSYYLENSFNYLASKGQEFHVYFYHGKFDKALKCTEELLAHSLSNAGKFRGSKFIYYKACVLFSMNDHQGALSLLNKSMEIEKDKGGWNLSLRILIIMIFVELDRIDEAITTLESLRKSIERTSKSDEVNLRDMMIVKLLRAMEKSDFKYDPRKQDQIKMRNSLSEKNKALSWEYYTPELVPFHQWVDSRRV